MAISFISSASAYADSVTLGTHQADDLLIAFAAREANATPPDLPAGWTNVVAGATADLVSSRVGFKIAASGSETSGTWTNAQGLVVLVYRGISTADAIGANSNAEAGGTATIDYPALTLDVTDGSSWVIWFAIHSWGSGTLSVPSGSTQRENPTGSTVNVAAFDSNAGVASWSATTGTAPGADDYQTRAVEILAGPSGPPSILTNPQDLAAIFGNSAAFTVNASSNTGDTLNYQWTENGSNVGTNASSYTTSQTFSADQNARFAVSVWDVNGTTQSQNAYLRLTFSSGAYAQEIADRYSLEDASGVYLIEPWGGGTPATTLGPFFVGPLNGLGAGGRFHKNRLH